MSGFASGRYHVPLPEISLNRQIIIQLVPDSGCRMQQSASNIYLDIFIIDVYWGQKCLFFTLFNEGFRKERPSFFRWISKCDAEEWMPWQTQCLLNCGWHYTVSLHISVRSVVRKSANSPSNRKLNSIELHFLFRINKLRKLLLIENLQKHFCIRSQKLLAYYWTFFVQTSVGENSSNQFGKQDYLMKWFQLFVMEEFTVSAELRTAFNVLE